MLTSFWWNLIAITYTPYSISLRRYDIIFNSRQRCFTGTPLHTSRLRWMPYGGRTTQTRLGTDWQWHVTARLKIELQISFAISLGRFINDAKSFWRSNRIDWKPSAWWLFLAGYVAICLISLWSNLGEWDSRPRAKSSVVDAPEVQTLKRRVWFRELGTVDNHRAIIQTGNFPPKPKRKQSHWLTTRVLLGDFIVVG